MSKFKEYVINLKAYYDGMENWPDAVLEFFKINMPSLRVYSLKNGMKFIGRPKLHDRGPILEVLLRGFYDEIPIESNYTILDIGAHIGTYTILALSKGAKVRCLEPSPETFRLLKCNISLNCEEAIILPKLMMHNEAIDIKKGKTKFWTNPEASGCDSIQFKPRLPSEQIEVETTTLDELLKYEDKIDILKCDCEGGEYVLLSSAYLLHKILRMIIEYHDLDEQRNGQKLKAFLRENGYNIKEKSYLIFAVRDNL